MKRLLNLLILLIAGFSFYSANAQFDCSTHHSDEFMKRLDNNVAYLSEHPETKDPTPRYVPIKFHLVANSQGEGRMPEEFVYPQLCLLNEAYDSMGLVFYIDGEFNYLDNSAVYEHEGSYIGTILQSKEPATLNLFIVNTVGNAGGYYSPSGDFVAIPSGYFAREDNVPFAHEVGHFLSLAHPHVGWEDEPYTPEQYGECVTLASIGSSQTGSNILVEYQDGSNCTTAADRICDTPPDYGFMQSANTCSNPWEGTVKDRNNDLIFTLPNSIMTYNGYACQQYTFTHGQANMMRADYDNRNNIEKDYVPDLTQITEAPAKNFPESFSTVDTYNAVSFDWEAVDGASAYMIVIGGQTNIKHITTSTSYFTSDLAANGSYSWNIVPINEIGSCVESETILFFTGDNTSSTNELQNVAGVNVFPNPVTATKDIQLSMEIEKAMDLEISLLSNTGKVISNTAYANNTKGSFEAKISTENVPSGIYLLKISSEEGQLVKRVLINE